MSQAAIEVEKIGDDLAADVMSCYQCAKCSSGCPVAARSDLKPHQTVRLIQMDQRDEVLASRFIWECTSCQTCATRCPQLVDIAALNDKLRTLSRSGGRVSVFNEIFLSGVRERGRVHELSLMASYKLRTGRLMEDADKAPMMLSKGKLPLFGARVGGRAERKAMFRRASQGGGK
jgi:heterodisulfide reductase subunit C